MTEPMTSRTQLSYDPDNIMETGEPSLLTSNQHVFDGERCLYCRVNKYDIGIYPGASEQCMDHEPITYTTESPGYHEERP